MLVHSKCATGSAVGFAWQLTPGVPQGLCQSGIPATGSAGARGWFRPGSFPESYAGYARQWRHWSAPSRGPGLAIQKTWWWSGSFGQNINIAWICSFRKLGGERRMCEFSYRVYLAFIYLFIRLCITDLELAHEGGYIQKGKTPYSPWTSHDLDLSVLPCLPQLPTKKVLCI